MAQTEKGIIYPFNYNEIADIPADLKAMAESIDSILSAYSLSTESGNKIVLEMNNSTYKIKAVLKDENNNTINTSNEIDLPLENMITDINYKNQSLVLTHKNGQKTNVDISDLVSEEHFDNTVSKLEDEINDLKTLIDTELDTNEVEGTEIDVNDSADYPGNIIPGGNMEQGTVANIEVGEFEQGDIHINGNLVSNNNTVRTKDFIKIYPNTLYNLKRSVYSSFVNFRFYDVNKVYLGSQGSENMVTTNQNSNRMDQGVSSMTMTIINPNVAYMKLADASNDLATIYTITTEETPTPNYPQPIETATGDNVINHCGKNLFYKTINRLWYNGNTKVFHNYSESTSIADVYIARVKPNTTYTVSKSTAGNRFVVVASTEEPGDGVDYNRTLIAQTDTDTTKYTFTTTDNENYIMFGFYRGTDQIAYDNANKNIMLEENSSATPYEPYKGKEYELNLGNIELCKMNKYKDYIYKNNNKWYLHKEIGKVVLDGSEDWTEVSNSSYSTTIKRYRYLFAGVLNTYISAPGILSNHFKGINLEKRDEEGIARQLESSGLNIFINNTTANNSADFKNWLSTHNIIVYYLLQSPIDIEITDPTLISQLEALNKAKWFKGVNHWWTETENLKPDLKCTYKVSNKLKNQNEIANLQAQIDELKIALAGTGEITVASANIADKSAELEVAEGEVE